ncbi:unnamed protein product [Vicia faba]|uniref:Peptidase A1 domain-containing protein n=1 Tax=Vicia faba TaxID=3906 RepID=A0AAV1A2J8_VICFA|nr:unnamed protein product [Vicia faba]
MSLSPKLFIFISFLSFTISISIAQTSFKPKALVLPISQDTSSSTTQYITQIKQRTPLVPIKLTLDLGGGHFWVNCEKTNYISSTSKPILCTSSQCSLFGSHGCSAEKICGRSPSNTVTGVSTYGDIHSDIVSIHSTNGNYSTRAVSVPNFLFICGSKVLQNALPKGVTGMAGLGRTKVSFPSQLSSAFSFKNKFAICLSSSSSSFPNSNGVLFFGDGPYKLNNDVSKVLTFTPLITNPISTAPSSFLGEKSSEYFIGVKSIRVSDKNVKLNTTLLSINQKGFGGTKISTVNPYTVMETSIYKAVVKAFVKELGVPTVAPVAPFGTCFASKDISFSPMGPGVPGIDLVLQNEKVKWSIIGANSMVSVENNDVICLGFVDAGSYGAKADQVGFVVGGSQPMTAITIGAHQLENNLLQFDLDNSRLGFSSLFLEHDNCVNFNFTSSA